MTKIAVLSDSHASFRNVGAARLRLGKVDWLLHAGDHLQDAERAAVSLGVKPEHVRAVVGNCDYPLTEPAEQLIDIDGVRILMTHGHLFGVKASYQRVYQRGQANGARVVIFGHTHVPVVDDDGVMLLLNPGSLSQPRVPGEPPTCALLTIEDGQPSAKLVSLT